MPNLNQVNIIGHLTRDPEVRYTPKGTAVAKIGVAVNREWSDEKGEKKSEVCFIEVTAWARLAEVCGEYLHKGDPAFFTGRLNLESWVDKTSQEKHSKLVVVAEGMQLLKVKPTGEQSGAEREARRTQQPPAQREPELVAVEDAIPC
jgi:single-strand DNA-binding protein